MSTTQATNPPSLTAPSTPVSKNQAKLKGKSCTDKSHEGLGQRIEDLERRLEIANDKLDQASKLGLYFNDLANARLTDKNVYSTKIGNTLKQLEDYMESKRKLEEKARAISERCENLTESNQLLEDELRNMNWKAASYDTVKTQYDDQIRVKLKDNETLNEMNTEIDLLKEKQKDFKVYSIVACLIAVAVTFLLTLVLASWMNASPNTSLKREIASLKNKNEILISQEGDLEKKVATLEAAMIKSSEALEKAKESLKKETKAKKPDEKPKTKVEVKQPATVIPPLNVSKPEQPTTAAPAKPPATTRKQVQQKQPTMTDYVAPIIHDATPPSKEVPKAATPPKVNPNDDAGWAQLEKKGAQFKKLTAPQSTTPYTPPANTANQQNTVQQPPSPAANQPTANVSKADENKVTNF